MSKRVRRLQLSRERLCELSSDDLRAVAGRGLTGTETYQCPTLPLKYCDLTQQRLTGTETHTCNA